MDNFKIDWAKVGIWIVIFLIAAAFWLYIAWQFKGCSGCSGCNDPEEFSVEQAKRDSAIELKIAGYRLQVDSLVRSNDSLEKCLDEMEQSRHEVLVHAITQNVIAENMSSDLLYFKAWLWFAETRKLDRSQKIYEFDSAAVLSMVKKKNEYEYLKSDRKLLLDEKDNYEKQIANYKWEVSDLTQINQLKDEQIVKLENLPRVVLNTKSRPWYVDAGIIAGSLAVGFTVGIVYKNNR
jgi:hypothetical protein